MTDPLRVYPYGYPVDIVSTSAAVRQAASGLWGGWPLLFDQPPLAIHIEAAPPGATTEAPVWSLEGSTLLLSSISGSAAFSRRLGTGWARIQQQTIEASDFAYAWLQAFVLTALDMVFFDPIHAACVSWNGRGILLCGDSGAGKTTLAYACAKSGWSLVSEDGVRLGEAEHGAILVGGRWTFHLREPAKAIFPELADFPLVPTPAGKQALFIDAEGQGLLVARQALPHRTIFLMRRPGPARISPANPDEALSYFQQTARNPDRSISEQRLRRFAGDSLQLEYDDVWDAVAQLGSLR